MLRQGRPPYTIKVLETETARWELARTLGFDTIRVTGFSLAEMVDHLGPSVRKIILDLGDDSAMPSFVGWLSSIAPGCSVLAVIQDPTLTRAIVARGADQVICTPALVAGLLADAALGIGAPRGDRK